MSISGEVPDKAVAVNITAIHFWTHGLYSIKTTRPVEFTFTPGQYARLALRDASGILIWRAYSVVSARDDDYLEYVVVDVPGGAFTTLLKRQQVGDVLWMEKQSYGFMTVDRFTDGADLWMLATGTGLGPFVSILHEAEIWQKFERLFVVHSVRQTAEFAYREQIEALAQRKRAEGARASLRWVGTATREQSSDPNCLHSRITKLLEDGSLERHCGAPLAAEHSRVMICGNPQMIEETRSVLHQRGMRPCRRTLPGQFLTENYW